MHLVAGRDEVVDRGDPLADPAGAHVQHPGVGVGHQREADPGAPCGSRSSSSRLTYLVAKDAFAVGSSRKVPTRSATLSLTSASTEQSLFSPMS